jgi:DNA-binding MarR family transcriptional regulator
MHSTFFSLKRGFLRTVNFARKTLEPFGVTPARFDILFTLKRGVRLQSQIWRILGLHPSTVCKIMRKLDDLGLIFRNYDADDRREMAVRLSPEGRALMEKIGRAVMEDGGLEGYVGWAAAGPHRPAARRPLAVLNLEESLLRVRRAFADSARLLYQFEPEEFEPEEWDRAPRAVMPDWPIMRERIDPLMRACLGGRRRGSRARGTSPSVLL